MSENRAEQKRGDLIVTLATYIFHLYNNGYQTQNEEINACCSKIINEASKPSKLKFQEGLTSFLEKEIHHNYTPTSEKIEKAIQVLLGDNISESIDFFKLGMEMVDVLTKLFPENYESKAFSHLKAVLTALYSDYDVNIFGNDKEQNLKSIRSYQYHQKLPWIARIVNRQADAIVEEWVMVEDVQDRVLCMDPYPWDDIEEDFELPIQDFLVRWELCNYTGVYVSKK